jgi:pyruvate kinase
MRRAKIVCTIGPSSSAPQTLLAMARAGMDVARLSCSHGDWDSRAQAIRAVREVSRQVGRPIGVLLDLAGPKFRLGEIPGGSLVLSEGESVRLCLRPEEGAILFALPELVAAAEPGAQVLIGDGAVSLTVSGKDEGGLTARVVDGGEVRPHQGVTLRETDIDVEAITAQDRKDAERGIAEGVDWIATSFVRDAADIHALRDTVRDVPLVAKIETRRAVDNMEEIVRAADGVMVARGDLGLQVPLEDVPHIQKRLILLCLAAGKPVITATQMLESMIENRQPTRAEATDVANAILDGTDAVMLSGETAIGRHPPLVVQTMSTIVERAEREPPRPLHVHEHPDEDATAAVARAACTLASALEITALLSCTMSGTTARMVSKFRPRVPILAMCARETTYHALGLVWGVCPLLVPPYDSMDDMVGCAMSAGVEAGYLHRGDRVVITAGVPPSSAGRTNLIIVEEVP